MFIGIIQGKYEDKTSYCKIYSSTCLCSWPKPLRPLESTAAPPGSGPPRSPQMSAILSFILSPRKTAGRSTQHRTQAAESDQLWCETLLCFSSVSHCAFSLCLTRIELVKFWWMFYSPYTIINTHHQPEWIENSIGVGAQTEKKRKERVWAQHPHSSLRVPVRTHHDQLPQAPQPPTLSLPRIPQRDGPPYPMTKQWPKINSSFFKLRLSGILWQSQEK